MFVQTWPADLFLRAHDPFSLTRQRTNLSTVTSQVGTSHRDPSAPAPADSTPRSQSMTELGEWRERAAPLVLTREYWCRRLPLFYSSSLLPKANVVFNIKLVLHSALWIAYFLFVNCTELWTSSFPSYLSKEDDVIRHIWLLLWVEII